MPTLTRIDVFPIKSFDAHTVSQAVVLPSGALENDRRYALVDSMGRHVNGKRFEAMHEIRASFDDRVEHVALTSEGNERSFSLAHEPRELAQWCSEVLGVKCRLQENAAGGFPDDRDSPGPTVVSTATLEVVAQWYGFSLEESRRRFRTNLEIASVPAFWEDQLAADFHRIRRFRIGETQWQGRGICERCIVPTRDSQAATSTTRFARDFAMHREQSLPAWSPTGRFDHFYRLAINTSLDSANNGTMICVGDEVELAEDANVGRNA